MKKLLGLLVSTVVLVSSLGAQGKFSGYMFGDYRYNIARDANFSTLSNVASASGSTAMQAFEFRRIYFAYDNDISEQFTSRFRLEADQSANASNGKVGVFVKDAYLRWKNIFSGSDLIFGIQPTPAYEISEAAWGYRSLEKTIMDLRGVVPSRDQGISLKGKLLDDGSLNYWFMWSNNSANSPETDKYKRYFGHVQYKVSANLQLTLNADYADKADIANAYTPGTTLSNGVLTYSAFLGYSEPFKYSFNVEAFMASTNHEVKDTLTKAYTSKNAVGVSVYGTYVVLPELSLVARYDIYDPSTDASSKDPAHVATAAAVKNTARNYIIVGLAWKADRNVQIIPNIQYETYTPALNRASIDPSLTARATFYYTFL
ncbi:MAG: hypothetical protein HY966_07265 [Ignavibacteriales bacterium]|nr:hypothetical protein [Ignavibacteriales bacterium]